VSEYRFSRGKTMPKKEAETMKPNKAKEEMPTMPMQKVRPIGPQVQQGMRIKDKNLRQADMPGKGMRKSPG
jgi:hypothetical protein